MFRTQYVEKGQFRVTVCGKRGQEKEEKTETDKAEEWIQNDLKAINIIYSAISDKQLEFVSEEETAYKIIKKLDGMYLKELTALQIVCRKRLEKLRLRNYSDSEAFFSDFEKR